MTPAQIVEALRRSGVAVYEHGGTLRLDGPTALLGSDLIAEARTNKGALLSLVRDECVHTPYPLENDCNTATPTHITGQVPEEGDPTEPLQLSVAVPLQSEDTATPHDTCGGAKPARLPGSPTVAVLPNCNTSATVTATPITRQVPERKSRETGDRCSVAVDLGGYEVYTHQPAVLAEGAWLADALEAAAAALWAAHDTADERGIDAADRAYLAANGAYVAWSDSVRRHDPATARAAYLEIRERLLSVERHARAIRNEWSTT